jgi:hypothetical protein
MCMCVLRSCVCVRLCMHNVCTYACACVILSFIVCLSVRARMYTCMHLYMCVCVYMYVYTYIHIYICIHEYMDTFIDTNLHMKSRGKYVSVYTNIHIYNILFKTGPTFIIIHVYYCTHTYIHTYRYQKKSYVCTCMYVHPRTHKCTKIGLTFRLSLRSLAWCPATAPATRGWRDTVAPPDPL